LAIKKGDGSLNITDIRPFIPSKDYELSRSFYTLLGFKGEHAGPDLTLFQKGSCTFFLHRNVDSKAPNSMMLQLIVDNIDEAYTWLSRISDLKHSEITQEPWGAVVYLWGPSGELWHITELNR